MVLSIKQLEKLKKDHLENENYEMIANIDKYIKLKK